MNTDVKPETIQQGIESTDELIKLTRQKLDALITFKKGLEQLQNKNKKGLEQLQNKKKK